jgi:pre-mRNA-splicing helicase BRR2
LGDHRLNLAHSAACQLDKSKLLKYNQQTGQMQATELGRIASNFYVTQATIATYDEDMKPFMGEIDLIRIITLSDEFKHIIIREEEKMEFSYLLDRVPIAIKESIEEPTSKVNILLQCYISRLNFHGFASQSDMIYVTQTSRRLIRCMFEISLRNGWAQLADKTLTLCKVVAWRTWGTQTPLRQFNGVPNDLIKKIEKKRH